MKILDARTFDCPKPVIETKKILDSITNGQLEVLVKDDTAKENMRKFLTSKNYVFSFEKNGEGYIFEIEKGDITLTQNDHLQEEKNESFSVLVMSDKMGEGDPELGRILIKSFFYTISEMDKLPKSIAFVNSAVNLTIEGSTVIEILKSLEIRGVQIVSCGTCLDFYNIKDMLKVGSISNMYTILEHVLDGTKILRI
jgi:selenium metabolism protein YedF